MTVKNHSKNYLKQMKKNKMKVELSFDNQAPVTKTWAVITEYPKGAALPALTPEDISPKLYEKLLKSNQLSMSYPDATGKILTAVFDVSGTKA